MINKVVKIDEFEKIILSCNLTVVDFYADWCGPCKRIAPYIEELSNDDSFVDITFLKVDVDNAEDIIEKYNIQSMPTFLFLKNGKEVYRFSGANKDKLLDTINKYK